MDDRWVVVETVQGMADEHQVVAFLEAHGIPTAVRGEALRWTHGFTLDGLGEVRVQVPAEHAEEARDLLRRVRSGELALDDETGETDPTATG